MRPRLRTLASVTAGMTFVLILLGVYTGATAAGLACNAQWPGTAGFLGLFPSTTPCLVEWFHRVVAMVTGFAILGTALVAWRGDYGRRIRYAAMLALVVLPVQVLLGANTIANFGVIAQVLHHAAALLILVGLVVTATLAFERENARDAAEAEADATEAVGAGD